MSAFRKSPDLMAFTFHPLGKIAMTTEFRKVLNPLVTVCDFLIHQLLFKNIRDIE